MLGQVVAEITHEIKNPLMMIGGFASQLIQKASDEKSFTKLNIIKDEVSRLETLIKELNELYIPIALNIESLDLNGLLEDVYKLVKDDCERKRIRTEIETEKGPVIVEGDRAKLKQAFLNLIKNATEAIEHGGNLAIKSKAAGDIIEITVADDGCGIPTNELEEVFSPFFTTKKDGTGLGLSISKHIIEEHDGSSFSLESEEGKGTVFKITMPFSNASHSTVDREL
jgi:signal transduction histidine kinase